MQTKVHNRKTTNYLGEDTHPRIRPQGSTCNNNNTESFKPQALRETHNATKKLVSLRSKLELSTNFLSIKTSGGKKN
jgi:hypothetical protein